MYPTLSRIDKTLAVYLMHWHISTSGAFSGTLQDRLVEKLPQKFPFAIKTIPAIAALMDIVVTREGGLKFLLEPNVDFPGEGVARQLIFQGDLNNFIETQ